MKLRREVIDRLLLCKSVLAKIRSHPIAEPDRHVVAQHILAAHDAAELALGAIADQRNKLPPKGKYYLMDYFDSLKELDPEGNIPGREYFRQINEARIGIKHIGNFPDPKQWARVGERVYEYVDEWCARYLVTSLDELDESALLRSKVVKDHFDSAKQALDQSDYQQVLVQLGIALHLVFKENRALLGLRVGTARPEDAIRLTGFGVHANDFLAMQEFLPEITESKDGNLHEGWKQSKFGHPGNWTDYAASFCLNTFLDVALKIQDAKWIPGAVPFHAVYEHRITALTDNVTVYKEVRLLGLGAGPAETLLGGHRSRQEFKVLARGESLTGRIRQEDSPGQGEIAFTTGGFEMIGTTLYVARRDVEVKCVPSLYGREYFPDLVLPEVVWQPE